MRKHVVALCLLSVLGGIGIGGLSVILWERSHPVAILSPARLFELGQNRGFVAGIISVKTDVASNCSVSDDQRNLFQRMIKLLDLKPEDMRAPEKEMSRMAAFVEKMSPK